MIMVDSRAGSVELLALLPPESCKKVTLEAADVAFFGYGPDGPMTMPIGIEYKTAKEALQCMHSGRLVGEQLPKCSQLYRRVYLLIEGVYKEGPEGELLFQGWKDSRPVWNSYSKATYTQFDNWLNSVVEVGQVHLKRSMDRVESAAQIYNLYRFWTKEYESHKSLMKFSKGQEPTLLSKPSVKRMVAAQIPGIGYELSGRVADYFPNILAMVNAEEREWTSINGIGKTKAKKIYSSLRT